MENERERDEWENMAYNKRKVFIDRWELRKRYRLLR